MSLIDDIFDRDFMQSKLKFGPYAQLDLQKLILGGHSFGGLNALSVA
jgi:predicted dienelactone hydrolase